MPTRAQFLLLKTRWQEVGLFHGQFFDTLFSKMIFLLLSALTWLLAIPAQQDSPAKPVVKSCGDSWRDSGLNAKKNRRKNSANETHPETGACIELAFSTLDIQEYLQSYARTQWKIGDEQVNGDSWTFSMELDKNELLRDTTDDSKNRRVEWTGGTVRVHLNTTRLPDGYSRTIVRASFRGHGRSADRFAEQKEYWQLESNNNFENSIVAILRSHFTPALSARTTPSRMPPEILLLALR